MKILVDTQVFIWLLNNDKRLGSESRQKLQDTSNKLFVSYFSFFEMAIKASIGKLSYDSTIINDLAKMGIEILMPSEDVLHNYTVFNPANRDPFDNALIAVARSEDCLLITSDSKILAVSASGLQLSDAAK